MQQNKFRWKQIFLSFVGIFLLNICEKIPAIRTAKRSKGRTFIFGIRNGMENQISIKKDKSNFQNQIFRDMPQWNFVEKIHCLSLINTLVGTEFHFFIYTWKNWTKDEKWHWLISKKQLTLKQFQVYFRQRL